jgi:hypothetical protein
MATLETGNNVCAFAQPIDDFAFAFIAPLSADNNHVCHIWTFLICNQTRVDIAGVCNKWNHESGICDTMIKKTTNDRFVPVHNSPLPPSEILHI